MANRPWTKSDEEYLARRYEKTDNKTIGVEMGRSASAITRRHSNIRRRLAATTEPV